VFPTTLKSELSRFRCLSMIWLTHTPRRSSPSYAGSPPGNPPSSKPGDPISAYDNLARPTITHLIRHLDSTGHRYQHVRQTLRRWVILFINPQVPVVCDWIIQSLPADQSYHVPLCPRPPLDRLVPRTAIPILPLSHGAPV
jgi:hypothetical protein